PQPQPQPQPEQRFDAAIEQVLGWPASDLTVQLIAARDPATADNLLSKHSAVSGLIKLTYPYNEAPRHTIVYGHFTTRAQAEAAVAKLPQALQNLKPWIRSVAGLKAELNQGLNP
ncbi:MAG: SPOR domain-containing protein, partial [Oceanospirillaceae bacterium]|nr:SPOR domain-containing protein [Oceanospirillaceae bacterium]